MAAVIIPAARASPRPSQERAPFSDEEKRNRSQPGRERGRERREQRRPRRSSVDRLSVWARPLVRDQHGPIGLVHDGARHAAEQRPGDGAPAARADDDQVGLPLPCQAGRSPLQPRPRESPSPRRLPPRRGLHRFVDRLPRLRSFVCQLALVEGRSEQARRATASRRRRGRVRRVRAQASTPSVTAFTACLGSIGCDQQSLHHFTPPCHWRRSQPEASRASVAGRIDLRRSRDWPPVMRTDAPGSFRRTFQREGSRHAWSTSTTSFCVTAGRCVCARRMGSGRRGRARVLLRPLRAELLPALPRRPADRASSGRAVHRAGLGRPRLVRRRGRRRRRRGAGRRARELRRVCATPRPPRSRSPSPTSCRARGIGTRLLEQLAGRAARGRHRAVRGRGDAREPGDAARLRGRRLRRRRASSRAASSRSRFPIAPTEAYLRARRRARPRRRRRLAAARSSRRGRSRSSAPRHGAARSAASSSATSCAADFTGAAYPVNRDGRAGRRRPRLRARSRRFPATSTSRSSASPASACSTPPRPRCAQGVRALCVISAGFAEIGPRGRRAPGAAARARPRARRAPDRPELPRHRRRARRG